MRLWLNQAVACVLLVYYYLREQHAVHIALRASGKVRTVCALRAPWAPFVNLANEKWFAL